MTNGYQQDIIVGSHEKQLPTGIYGRSNQLFCIKIEINVCKIVKKWQIGLDLSVFPVSSH